MHRSLVKGKLSLIFRTDLKFTEKLNKLRLLQYYLPVINSYYADVNVRPSVPSIPTLEGGGTGTGGDGNGGAGGGGTGGNGNGGSGGDATLGSGNGSGQVEVCIELSSGNLQRNVSVNVATVSSPTSTGMLPACHGVPFIDA